MKNKYQFLLFVPVLIVYIIGMFIDVMEIDAAQYAAMSREMLDAHNYLEIYDRGVDYLDKPPLLFWLSTLSFKLFGISNFSYKLPSVLFSILALFSTYHLGKALRNERTGFYSALILSSCQAYFLINHDVRTDTILAACTIFSIWQLYLFTLNNRFLNLFFGALGIGGAMLTKGPIGIMVPALALGFHLLVRREWKTIFKWQWLLIIPLVLIFLSPMLVGLYLQYDLQPGKLIHGVPIQSGLQFFFWTQSFGRITGESIWKDDTTPLFFTHTFLWAFLPWCLLFVVGFWSDTKKLILSKFKLSDREEAITWGGFVFPFVAFSLSHYKLPHYIFVVFPLAAILAGKYAERLFRERNNSLRINILRGSQFFISLLLYGLAFLLCFFSFPLQSLFLWSIFVVGLGLSIYFVWKGQHHFQRIVIPCFIAIVVLNFLLNMHFYPALSHYAAANQAAQMVRASPEESKSFVTFHEKRYGLDFYSRQCIPDYDKLSDLMEEKKKETIWIFTNTPGYEEIKATKIKITEEKKLEDFRISRLSIKFLNPSTRVSQIKVKYLLKVEL
ncbi:MAG: glycosyltransferase family 39 protein [Chryseolinea sp.]